ncbi:MAG TPA: HAD-IIIA family hydrolase [Synergistales bacterium]|nr:HAD-IIIA family hydrolase [Synergistales bacterium]
MKTIKLLVLDVDGTLTDGGVYMDGRGGEFKRFDVRDGMGIVRLRAAGVRTAFLSGRRSEATSQRAADLGVELLFNGVREKLPVLRSLLSDLSLSAEEAAYMGDDVNDVDCLRAAGLAFAPADAVPEAKSAADFVTSAKGGGGAVREAAEHIISLNARCEGRSSGAEERP